GVAMTRSAATSRLVSPGATLVGDAPLRWPEDLVGRACAAADGWSSHRTSLIPISAVRWFSGFTPDPSHRRRRRPRWIRAFTPGFRDGLPHPSHGSGSAVRWVRGSIAGAGSIPAAVALRGRCGPVLTRVTGLAGGARRDGSGGHFAFADRRRRPAGRRLPRFVLSGNSV